MLCYSSERICGHRNESCDETQCVVGAQVNDLVQSFDFAVVEQCYQYSECSNYDPFIRANKAVLIAEYRTWNTVKQYCNAARVGKYSLVKKGGNKRDGSATGYDVTAFPWCSCSIGKCF